MFLDNLLLDNILLYLSRYLQPNEGRIVDIYFADRNVLILCLRNRKSSITHRARIEKRKRMFEVSMVQGSISCHLFEEAINNDPNFLKVFNLLQIRHEDTINLKNTIDNLL